MTIKTTNTGMKAKATLIMGIVVTGIFSQTVTEV
tara:strand:- start:487 stop:588 length:102 start_codon:yes stop_codon:yes gene_type:complete